MQIESKNSDVKILVVVFLLVLFGFTAVTLSAVVFLKNKGFDFTKLSFASIANDISKEFSESLEEDNQTENSIKSTTVNKSVTNSESSVTIKVNGKEIIKKGN